MEKSKKELQKEVSSNPMTLQVSNVSKDTPINASRGKESLHYGSKHLLGFDQVKVETWDSMGPKVPCNSYGKTVDPSNQDF